MAFTIADYGDSVSVVEDSKFVAYQIADDALRAFRTRESVVEYLRAFSATEEYWAKVVDWLQKPEVPALSIFNGAFTDTWVKHVPPNYLDDKAYVDSPAVFTPAGGEQWTSHNAD